MGQYENDGSVAVNIAKVLLLLVNMAFLVGGGLLIFFSQRVRSAGWLDAFDNSDYAWVGNTMILFILILGAVVIVLAAVGCFGAWQRNRVLLTVYAVVLVITAALFIVVAVGANSVKNKANDWHDTTYPAAKAEEAIGTNFNQLYCYAQVTFYCQTATVANLSSLFNLNLPSPVSAVIGSYTLTNLCGLSNQPDQLASLCDVCKLVNRYSKYAPVADWASDSCPQSPTNQLWCGTFLMAKHGGKGKEPETFAKGSPYNECRGAFLDLVVKWSTFLFASALIVTISTVAVFGFACLVRQGTNRPYLDDSFVVDSPDRY